MVQWNTNPNSTNVVFNQVNMGAFGWKNMAFVVTAATNTTSLQFGFRNDNDFFCLDGVSVMPLPAPALQAPALANGTVYLAWSALPGGSHQVQYMTNLAQTSWVNLGGVGTATTNPMTNSDTTGANSRRFYRVVLLP